MQDAKKLLIVLNKSEEIRGRTRFQKIVFLLEEKEGVDFAYDFIPYHYGPYSQDLQIEIDLLEAAGLVDVQPNDGALYVHRLTERGLQIARDVERKMDKARRTSLSRALREYRRRSTNSLIGEAKSLSGITT